MKGAAFAALGEIPTGFLFPVASLADIKDGVKLGESTFNAFFRLLLQLWSARPLIACFSGTPTVPCSESLTW